MSRLLLTARHRHAIERHAAAAYPEECCGVLIGRFAVDSGGCLVEQILPARNEHDGGRHNRYVIPPRAVLAAHKAARARGLDVVGYYHSHPDHPAEPSDFDREHAWPGLTYVIVSVEEGRPAALRGWRLRDDRERFEEEPVVELSRALARPRSGRPGRDELGRLEARASEPRTQRAP